MKLIKIILPCLLLGGCFGGTSREAKFYTQSAILAQTISSDYTDFVVVNRIQLPKYIDRPQIITQLKDSVQINMSEYNRWVEAPSILSTRTLIENLSILLPSAKIKVNNVKGEGVDKTVSVEIIKLNAVLEDKAELVAWYIVKDKQGKVLANQKFTGIVEIGKTYDDIALGYSKLLGQLSQEIANILVENTK